MRLAWGVLSLTISLLLVMDLLLGLFPSEHERLRAVRERSALNLATQVRVMLAQPRAEAQLSAVLDALAQDAAARNTLETALFAPLEARLTQEAERLEAETAATKVDFFTMVRGED